MTEYRKKPIVIEAFKWTGGIDQQEDPIWIVDAIKNNTVRIKHAKNPHCEKPVMSIRTLEGVMTAQMGDYIIRGVQGEIYPCKPDIFEATYEKAEESGLKEISVDEVIKRFSENVEESLKSGRLI